MDKGMIYYIAIVGFLCLAIATVQYLARPKQKQSAPAAVVADDTATPTHWGISRPKMHQILDVDTILP